MKTKELTFQELAVIAFNALYKKLYLIFVNDSNNIASSKMFEYFALSENEAKGKFFTEFPVYCMKDITRIEAI